MFHLVMVLPGGYSFLSLVLVGFLLLVRNRVLLTGTRTGGLGRGYSWRRPVVVVADVWRH